MKISNDNINSNRINMKDEKINKENEYLVIQESNLKLFKFF